MSTTITTPVLDQIVAVLDADMPARVSPVVPVKAPDFFEYEMAWWIGRDAVVACDINMLAHLGTVLDGSSFKAQHDVFPVECGIAVMPFDLEFVHMPSLVLSRHSAAYGQWRLACETVLNED